MPYPFFFEAIPQEFKLVAEKELNETDERRNYCFKKLKESLNAENIALQDYEILAALRNQKFDIQKTEARLKKFYHGKQRVLQGLAQMDMGKIETIVDDMGFGFLPYRDKNGRVIIYTHPDGIKLDKYSIHEIGLVMVGMCLILSKSPLTTVTGVIYIPECKTDSMYVIYASLKEIRTYLNFLGAAPLRVPRVEVLNAHPIVRWFAKMVFPILGKKLVGRVHFHEKGYKTLHRLYDPKFLPQDFDGQMGPRSNGHYRQRTLEFIKELRNRNL